MKKIKRIKKAYKEYGTDQGYAFLSLLCSYREGVRRVKAKGLDEQDKAINGFRMRFNQYVQDRYGQRFLESYADFYQENRDNQKLLKAIDKKQKEFLDYKVLQLVDEPEKPVVKKDEKANRQVEQLAQKDSSQRQSANIKPKVTTPQASPYGTPKRSTYNLNSRVRHSYQITFKRLETGELFTRFYSGKDKNEAMTIANRLYFDSATIIDVHEEKKTN